MIASRKTAAARISASRIAFILPQAQTAKPPALCRRLCLLPVGAELANMGISGGRNRNLRAIDPDPTELSDDEGSLVARRKLRSSTKSPGKRGTTDWHSAGQQLEPELQGTTPKDDDKQDKPQDQPKPK
jgi:hypothetical protein